MLFKVYKRSEENTPSYIFGTLHARSSKAYQYYNIAKSKLQDVKTFAAEIDLTNNLAQHPSLLFRLPQGRPIKSWMGKRKYQRARTQIIKSFGLDIERNQLLQPTYIISTIAANILNDEYPFALDYQLFLDAKEYQLEISGLETMADQLHIISSLDFGLQAKQLQKLAENPSLFVKKIKHQEFVYSINDIRRLYNLSRNELGVFRKILLKERNLKMKDQFIKLMNEGPVFGAVGASHLGGQFGLLSTLKSEGLKLIPVN